MALIKCYECGEMVSERATICPKCGAPILMNLTKVHINDATDEFVYRLPQLTFGQAVRTCFRKYATFTGRARRSEYWYFTLFQLLTCLLTTILCFIPSPVITFTALGPVTPFSILNSLWGWVLLLPNLSVQCRRLHDVGKSGWNILFLILFEILFLCTILMPILLEREPNLILLRTFCIISLALGICFLIWNCTDSSKDTNKYGPSPKYIRTNIQQKAEEKHSDESSNEIKTSSSSMEQVKGVGKAHLEAMRALQEAKEQRTISEDVVQDIKNTHREFLAKQEKREKEAVREEQIASSIESRHVETAQAETAIFIEKKPAMKQPQAEMLSCNEAKENVRHRREIIRTAILTVGVYVVFLLLLLTAGYVSGNRGIRYYANGFYAWIGWQPFDDAKAFERYPLVDLFSGNTDATGK